MKRVVVNNAGYNEITLNEVNENNFHIVYFGEGVCGIITQDEVGKFYAMSLSKQLTEHNGWIWKTANKTSLIEYILTVVLSRNRKKSIGVFEIPTLKQTLRYLIKKTRR